MSTSGHLKHDTRNSPPSLWEEAVRLWNELVLGFGHPIDLMRWGWMRALEHRALGHWLRDLEEIVRRAIRADVRELDPAELKLRPIRPRPPKPPPTSNEEMPRLCRSYADDPLTWKVSFYMSPPGQRPNRGLRKSRAGYQPAERRPCRAYALRIEALRRAIRYRTAYVTRYAHRLARRLARAEQEARAFEALCAAYVPPPDPANDAPAALPDITPRNAKLEEPG